MFEVDRDPILKLQRRLHCRRVAKHVVTVQMDHGELDFLDGELLTYTGPGANAEGDECVRMTSFLLVAGGVEPLRPEQLRLREVDGVLGEHA